MRHSATYNLVILLKVIIIESMLVVVSPLLYKKDLPHKAARDAQDFY